MIRLLPTLKGYTVDERLCEFRKVIPEAGFEFIDFDSPKGKLLYAAYVISRRQEQRERVDKKEAKRIKGRVRKGKSNSDSLTSCKERLK